MANTPQLIQLTIVALLAGLTIPLLLQLFLTARSVQRASASVERQLTDARRELHEVLATTRRDGGSGDLASMLAGAAVPALIAGIRAFRSTVHGPDQPNGVQNQPQEKVP